MKQGKVIIQSNLVVGYWELISMESGAELLAPLETSIVRVAEETRTEKKQSYNF